MYIEEILIYLANLNFSYEYILIFFVISILLLSLPIPYTIIIVSNVYVFGWIGFFIVTFSVPLGSYITLFYIRKFSNFLKKYSFFDRIINKSINNKIKFYKNLYILFIARATLPFYLVSVILSLMDISIKKYLYITSIGTFLNILLVSMITNSIRDSIISYNKLAIPWSDPRLIISLFALLIFVYVSKKISPKLYD